MFQEIFIYEANICDFNDDSCEKSVIYFQESYKQIIVPWGFPYSCLIYDLCYLVDINIPIQFESLLSLFPFETLVYDVRQVYIEVRKEPFCQECCFFDIDICYKNIAFDIIQ